MTEHTGETSTAAGPLSGIRVIDFTRVLAGPFGTQILGDLGADVIKVENPASGDDTRSVRMQGAVAGETSFFLAMNRSKRSLTLDLKSGAGRAVALDLIASADVVVENFTAPVMRRFQLDYPSLKDRFSRLIYCSISAYGRSGSKADAAGYDFPISAEAGIMALNANAGTRPVQGLVPFTDISTAYNAVIGILAALHDRNRTGRGQHVDVSMFDTALANLTYHGQQFLVTGEEPQPTPEHTARPRGLFETADGAIVLAVTGEKMFRKFCTDVAQRADWLDDAQIADEAFRMADRDVLLPQLTGLFRTKTSAEWSALFERAGLPCGKVRSAGEALSSSEAQERGMILDMPHPAAGSVPGIGHGFRLGEAPFGYRAPPLLGQHSREVLAELPGYDDERIEALFRSGTSGE